MGTFISCTECSEETGLLTKHALRIRCNRKLPAPVVTAAIKLELKGLSSHSSGETYAFVGAVFSLLQAPLPGHLASPLEQIVTYHKLSPSPPVLSNSCEGLSSAPLIL